MLTAAAIIGVCGAGAMGSGIAEVAARAGHSVIVFDSHDEALRRGALLLAKNLDALVARGKLEPADASAIAARVTWSTAMADLAPASLIIEAIVENAEAKMALFSALEKAATPAILATNTSSLSVTMLAAALTRPERFLGLHFFNPAAVMKLVEIVPGLATDAAVVASAAALIGAWGKKGVIAKDAPGFIVNRVARPFYGEGWRALEEGAADAATIDRLMRACAGFRMGPFELGDLIGHDINVAAAKSVFAAYHGRARFRPSLMQAALVDAGRMGRKSGRGVYSYAEEKQSSDAKAPAQGDRGPLRRLIRDFEGRHGGARLVYGAGEPVGRLARETGASIVAVDYIHDAEKAETLAFAASDARARAAALDFSARAGLEPIEIAGRPGLIVFRTLLQLANAAADAVLDQAAAPEAIDLAMRAGVNYPFGPIEWAKGYGLPRVVAALEAIEAETGDALYGPSEWLRAAARDCR